MTPKLTVNLGLRYELWSPIDERFGRQANFDLQNLTLYIPKGPNQDAPLPPNFATAFPTIKVSRGQVPSTLDSVGQVRHSVLASDSLTGLMDKTVFGSASACSTAARRIRAAARTAVKACRSMRPSTWHAAAASAASSASRDPQCTGCNYFPNGLTGGYPTNVFTLPAPVSFRGVQNDFRNPLVHKWNVMVQRELPGNMALEVGYEGNHQAHQLILWNSDPCPNIGFINNPALSCENARLILPPAGWCARSATVSR